MSHNNDNPSSHSSVGSVIETRAVSSPESVFLIDPRTSKVITYRQALVLVRHISSELSARGMKPGDAIAYAFGNSTDSAVAILGIMHGNFLATAINLRAGKDVISYVLQHSEAKLILCDEVGRTEIDALDDNSIPILDIHEITNNTDSGTPGTSSHVISPDLTAAEQEGIMRNGLHPALLMYTSGTTGLPKGVVLSHRSIIAGGQNTALSHKLTAADRGMCVLPLYHINGLCVTLMGTLVAGGGLLIPPRFSTSTFWSDISSHACTWVSVVPTQVSYLLSLPQNRTGAEEANKLRFVRSASAPLSRAVHEAFEERFKVALIETMGLTETAGPILSNQLPPGKRKKGSAGVAQGNEIIIADVSQREVEPGTEGEVLVRGSNVMSHYLKNPDATAATITIDGWLRTGDLGTMDEDGYVYITGRLKELIIKGGENIAPREIDEALYTHADVVEAAAFSCKCDTYGETVEAAVKLSDSSVLTEGDLLQLCKDRVGKFKCPDRIYVLPDLPKGPSGKIQRSKIFSIVK